VATIEGVGHTISEDMLLEAGHPAGDRSPGFSVEFFDFFLGGFRNSNGSLHSTSNYCLAGGAPKSKPRREGKQFEARHGRKSEMAEAAIQCD